MGKPTVFIDGEAGTTGLQIYHRLAERADIELIRIRPELRKDPKERANCLNQADVCILCLPDDAAREAVGWIENEKTKVLDASTAHRTAEGWVYGFPEMTEEQRSRIASSRRISNPGCYPTGFLSLVAPLVQKQLIPADFPVTINAVSGYTGGGNKMIAQYEQARAEQPENGESSMPYSPYGLSFGHKHVKEMQKYSGLAHPPLFVPAVGDFAQGMVVQVPLPLWSLDAPPSGQQLHEALKEHYKDEPLVQVMPYGTATPLKNGSFLEAKTATGTNELQLCVFANDETQEALLVARLDNLGKGASGAAVQNLNIMLGLTETAGLL